MFAVDHLQLSHQLLSRFGSERELGRDVGSATYAPVKKISSTLFFLPSYIQLAPQAYRGVVLASIHNTWRNKVGFSRRAPLRV
jgi:hypothetical protein